MLTIIDEQPHQHHLCNNDSYFFNICIYIYLKSWELFLSLQDWSEGAYSVLQVERHLALECGQELVSLGGPDHVTIFISGYIYISTLYLSPCIMRAGVIVISLCFLLSRCNCVRCEGHPSPSSAPLTLCSHPGQGYCLSYLSSQLITKSRKKADILHQVCPDPLRGEMKQRKEKCSPQCPWLWGLGCQQWIRGRERIVHLSPIQFSPSQHFQHKTETQCSVIVRLLTLHATPTSDMGQLERWLFILISQQPYVCWW